MVIFGALLGAAIVLVACAFVYILEDWNGQ